MRILLFILVVLAANVWIEKPAAAQNYPWCAYYNFDRGGARNCGFATFQQCQAAVSGVGGNCSPSPYYQQQPYYPSVRTGLSLLIELLLPQKLRQLGNIRRDPSRLIFGKYFCRRSSSRPCVHFNLAQD
jgi:hypothetical protein